MNKTAMAAAIIGGIAIAGLAAFSVIEQQTIVQLRQENQALKEQVGQIAPLQEQIAQQAQVISNSGVGAEAQLHEVAKLRAEVTKLRGEAQGQTADLAKARKEIDSLNQKVASQSDAQKADARATQAVVQEAVDQKIKAIQNQNACINNLRLIDSAKQQWALENKKQATDVPTLEDLRPYIGRGPNGDLPACPDGGTYTVGAVSEKPTCSVAGHALP